MTHGYWKDRSRAADYGQIGNRWDKTLLATNWIGLLFSYTDQKMTHSHTRTKVGRPTI